VPGCPCSRERVRRRLAELSLLGSGSLASADAAFLPFSSQLPQSPSLEMCSAVTRFFAMVFARLHATLADAVCCFAPIFAGWLKDDDDDLSLALLRAGGC